MGNSTSTEHDDENNNNTENIETLGYRVLGVQPNSPSSKAGLVSFFDFLLGCNNQMLLDENNEDIDFVQVLKDNIGKELELLVFNIKSESTRLVKMTPSDTWGGHGLLGVTIRLDDYAHADERLIRILSISPSSPAFIAGLQPLKDYLLGTSTVSFSSDLILCDILDEYDEKVIEIYVYNTDSDEVRVVNLMPSLAWGDGEGLLGAEVGTGYLHRLPNACRDTVGKSMEREVNKVRLLDDIDDNNEEIVDLTGLTTAADDNVRASSDSITTITLEDEKKSIDNNTETNDITTAMKDQQSNANNNITTTNPLPPPPLSGGNGSALPTTTGVAMSTLPLPPPPIMKTTAH